MALEQKSKEVVFGKAAKADFTFAETWTNLNHGSFGTFPKEVRNVLRKLQEQAEERPDVFIRYQFPQLLDAAREATAKLVNVPSSELVFVPNATTGVNTVMRNIEWQQGDVIIYFPTIYGACEKTIAYITETTPAEDRKIVYTYPVSDEWLIAEFERTIASVRKEGKNPRLAILDTVVSMPGVRMPYEKLLEVCKREGILSLVDAAHAIGMLSPKELDLGKLQPDFFVSNCHKWLFAPRGCAMLHVPLRNQPIIRSTLPTSHGFVPRPKPGEPLRVSPLPHSAGKTPWVANFDFVGTIDNAPYLCVPAAISYRARVFGGEDAIAAYLKRLAGTAGHIVASSLGTFVMDNEARSLTNCAFANVRLPLSSGQVFSFAEPREAGLANVEVLGGRVRDWIALTLIKEYDTFIQVYWYDGCWWTRLSAQVYLEEADYERAAVWLGEVCARVRKGEWTVAPEGIQARL